MGITDLPKPFFMLAPMEDVTDTVFRQIIISCASPDLLVTEFTNVDGLNSPGEPKVRRGLDHPKEDQPLIAQLWGITPDNFKKTAELIAKGEYGNFIAVDLNMGCPVKAVVKEGACSALINNRELASQIINATKEGLNGKLPLSVKTRLGYNEIDLSWAEFLLSHNLDMLVIHGRTRKQMSKVPADWQAIEEIRKLRDKLSPKTLIVGNGDVLTREQGLELANAHGLDGIMIGRGIFNDPFVFAKDSPWQTYTKKQKVELFKKHVQLSEKTWKGTKPVQLLNKYCKIYINNFPGAKEFREKLMAAGSTAELLKMLS